VSDSADTPKLFISYRRDETPVSAAWLYEVLVERFGESSVFMDLTLKPGEDFVERITDVLGSCHILLLVMGPRWAAPNDGTGPASIRDPDDFVRLEAEVAMARGDVEVLPVLVGGAKMPHRDELPEKIQGLTRIQAKQLTDNRRAADMRELVARVEELLPLETVVHDPDPPPPPKETLEAKREGQPRRWIARVAVVGAVAGLLAAVVLVATGGLAGGDDKSGESGTLGASNEPGKPTNKPAPDSSEAEPGAELESANTAAPRGSKSDWPEGTSAWTVVLASVGTRDEAEARRDEAERYGDAGILRSDDYSSLREGYWVVFAGQYTSGDEVQAAAERWQGGQFSDAYPRFVEP
jgi:hypothetical protein